MTSVSLWFPSKTCQQNTWRQLQIQGANNTWTLKIPSRWGERPGCVGRLRAPISRFPGGAGARCQPGGDASRRGFLASARAGVTLKKTHLKLSESFFYFSRVLCFDTHPVWRFLHCCTAKTCVLLPRPPGSGSPRPLPSPPNPTPPPWTPYPMERGDFSWLYSVIINTNLNLNQTSQPRMRRTASSKQT